MKLQNLTYLITLLPGIFATPSRCPLLGPSFPKPSGLSSNKIFQDALQALEKAIDTAITTGETPFGSVEFNGTTFSVGLFSTCEARLLYEKHHTDPSVAHSSVGTNTVDADSIYRMGSISKLLSAYLFLIVEGDGRFNDPITKYIPELLSATSHSSSSNGVLVDWNQITLGELASHLGGISRDFGFSDHGYPFDKLTDQGFPTVPASQIPACNYVDDNFVFRKCSREELLNGISAEPAMFQPSQTPLYSNEAFQLLGLVLENITGESFSDLFESRLLKPLGLRHTLYESVDEHLTNQFGVVAGKNSLPFWEADAGNFGPAGGMFSSTNDFAAIGRAMLSSSLMSSSLTRRWMKPRSFLSDMTQGVGAPWEIRRTQLGSKQYDFYTKNGGIQGYTAIFALVPDLDIGFSILTSGPEEDAAGGAVWASIGSMIGSLVVPKVEDVARDEASVRLAGHYVAKDLNSSLTISTDEFPGIRVTNWISNGSMILDGLKADPTMSVDFRLYPNDLYTEGQVGFTGQYEIIPEPSDQGLFNSRCGTWGGVDSFKYANVGIESFIFNVDETTGIATRVEPKALRVSLMRQS